VAKGPMLIIADHRLQAACQSRRQRHRRNGGRSGARLGAEAGQSRSRRSLLSVPRPEQPAGRLRQCPPRALPRIADDEPGPHGRGDEALLRHHPATVPRHRRPAAG
jgi:hypothetical protein